MIVDDVQYLMHSENIIVVLKENSIYNVCDISTMNFYKLVMFHSHIALYLITPETLCLINNFVSERDSIKNSYINKVSLCTINYHDDFDDNLYDKMSNILEKEIFNKM